MPESVKILIVDDEPFNVATWTCSPRTSPTWSSWTG